jgi:DDE superfamily endonuclease
VAGRTAAVAVTLNGGVYRTRANSFPSGVAGRGLLLDQSDVAAHGRGVSASSKNYRYSANLRVRIDANTRLTVAVGDPLPGNRNDCRAFTESGVDRACEGARVMADGGYQGNPGVVMPCRKPRDGSELPQWKQDRNIVHKRVRARVEHFLAHMKSWNVLRTAAAKDALSTTPPAQSPSYATSQ